MRTTTSILILCLSFLMFCGSNALAGEHPELEKVLTNWKGPREVVLRSDLKDPLASPLVQELVELLLEHDMAVVPTSLDAPAGDGLTLDLRGAQGGSGVLLVRRASDGAILAMERFGALPKPIPLPTVKAPAPKAASNQAPSSVPPPLINAPRPSSEGVLSLSNSPVGLLALSGSDGSVVDMLLLAEDGIEAYQLNLRHFSVQKRTTFPPMQTELRPLYLDGGDLTGDGRDEVAVVWAEDVKDRYAGTASKIHSRLYTTAEGSLQPAGDEWAGYLRIIDQQAFWQDQGEYSLVTGPVLPVQKDGDQFVLGKTPQPWSSEGLFAGIPWSDDQFLAWKDDAAGLQVINPNTDDVDQSLALFDNFGPFRGAEVAIPLKNPQYNLTYSRDDAITEEYHSLPRRMMKGADGAIYTIWRGREPGLPLIGSPSGQDSVVRVIERKGSLQLQRPFPGVDGFILDFALLQPPDGPLQVLLLVNDKEKGNGQAHLRLLSAN